MGGVALRLFFGNFKIFFESEETTILFDIFNFFAEIIEKANKGLFFNILIFLCFIDFDSDLAGINTQKVLFFLFFIFSE